MWVYECCDQMREISYIELRIPMWVYENNFRLHLMLRRGVTNPHVGL